MQEEIRTLEKRVLELSYKHKLCHIGSCIGALPVINGIYMQKKKGDTFILSCGHAHLAHLVVREKFEGVDAEELLLKGNIHCDRSVGCDVSTGSLGNGLPIGIGIALAKPKKTVYCVISDGEMAEGSIWESFTVIESQQIKNIKVYMLSNGYGAYSTINLSVKTLYDFLYVYPAQFDQYPFLKGLDAHYYKMTKEDYEEYVCK